MIHDSCIAPPTRYANMHPGSPGGDGGGCAAAYAQYLIAGPEITGPRFTEDIRAADRGRAPRRRLDQGDRSALEEWSAKISGPSELQARSAPRAKARRPAGRDRCGQGNWRFCRPATNSGGKETKKKRKKKETKKKSATSPARRSTVFSRTSGHPSIRHAALEEALGPADRRDYVTIGFNRPTRAPKNRRPAVLGHNFPPTALGNKDATI